MLFFVARTSACSAVTEKKLDISLCEFAILARISWRLGMSLAKRPDYYLVELRDAAVL